MPTPRVTYVKTDAAVGAMSTYNVLLDGTIIGKVSKVRDRYLRRVGRGRGQNVPAARDAWMVEGQRYRINYDTRIDAVVSLVEDHLDTHHGAASAIVRSKS